METDRAKSQNSTEQVPPNFENQTLKFENLQKQAYRLWDSFNVRSRYPRPEFSAHTLGTIYWYQEEPGAEMLCS